MGVAKPSSQPLCCDEESGANRPPLPDFGAKLIILPENFVGNRKIPDQPYVDTLVSIDSNGDMNLVDKTAFQLAANRDLIQSKTSLSAFQVDGDNHGGWIITQGASPVTTVNVFPAVAHIDGVPAPAPNSVIIFTQDSDSQLVFVAAQGVTVKSPGLLRAHGRNSTVTLMARDEFTWFLGGDVAFGEVAVP